MYWDLSAKHYSQLSAEWVIENMKVLAGALIAADIAVFVSVKGANW